jgi:hypothetical protein
MTGQVVRDMFGHVRGTQSDRQTPPVRGVLSGCPEGVHTVRRQKRQQPVDRFDWNGWSRAVADFIAAAEADQARRASSALDSTPEHGTKDGKGTDREA